MEKVLPLSRAQDDLKRATKLAYAQIKQFGMSKNIGLISFPADRQNPQNDDFGVKPYSKRLQRMMDEVIIFPNLSSEYAREQTNALSRRKSFPIHSR